MEEGEGEGQPRTHLIYTDDRNNLQQMIWQINRMTAAQQLIKEKDEPHSSGMMETDVPGGMSDFTEARSTENVSESKTEHRKCVGLRGRPELADGEKISSCLCSKSASISVSP